MASYAILKSDIIKVSADAIVYSANTNLMKGSGISRAVFMAAGDMELMQALRRFGQLPEGEAIITSGYKLPAKYLIHTVTPKYYKQQEGNVALFSQCFFSCLSAAARSNVKTLAVPFIGCGNHGWPLADAVGIMVDTIHWVLERHPEFSIKRVIFVAYDDKQLEVLKRYMAFKKLACELME